jgi:Leucine-rich repeat (LRR) protein
MNQAAGLVIALLALSSCLVPVTDDGGVADDGGLADAGERACGAPGEVWGIYAQQLRGCVRLRAGLNISEPMRTRLDIPNLTSLRHIEERLTLEFQPKLESLSGLEQLETLGGLLVKDCPSLTRLDGFTGLRELRSLGILRGNNRLGSLKGFAPLASFQGELFIADSQISSLEGLEQVTSLASLDLINSPIRSLAGLASLRTIRGDLTIDLRLLPRSEVDAFLRQVQVDGTTTIVP